ncbi:LOW QUALITY PROTEIN: GPI-anchored protein LORELEI [Eutrema salsugineum]|uniref:LOW QUALITY PROTEIN: GPI-anchored protein LORELEI n=1 Tax=Eutrema salsugineum TaxID=72664 RepID=UPI000CED66E3|nr:LOW QUALITY PROTEIN: GPI-anchored protein LORELEI [Eutrema salsugineum]
MELKLLFLLMTSLVTLSSSSSISDSVLESQTSVTERSVLHTKKKCEVNFEYMNYTAMTKRCKGPAFPAKECCLAFKEFACPYANQINDMNSDCAKTMFSYMNIYGNYPTGLFANEAKCKETKDGLVCPPPPLSSLSLNASTADSTAPRLITLLISATTTVLAFLALA